MEVIKENLFLILPYLAVLIMTKRCNRLQFRNLICRIKTEKDAPAAEKTNGIHIDWTGIIIDHFVTKEIAQDANIPSTMPMRPPIILKIIASIKRYRKEFEKKSLKN